MLIAALVGIFVFYVICDAVYNNSKKTKKLQQQVEDLTKRLEESGKMKEDD